MDKQNSGPDGCGPQARYFSRLDEGVFEIQRCQACEKHQFFPRVLCQHCGSTDLTWVVPGGKGRVYSFSVIRRKPESGGNYNVALIDLDEGVRLMSRVDGIAHEALHIGMDVLARVVTEQGKGLLVFFPEGQK
ncbi:OB-fold domain-containing protein [Alcaligenaceae bacterium]|nr:OB-fold domain-containing protein [Alcaligenaceae bacterium]